MYIQPDEQANSNLVIMYMYMYFLLPTTIPNHSPSSLMSRRNTRAVLSGGHGQHSVDVARVLAPLISIHTIRKS